VLVVLEADTIIVTMPAALSGVGLVVVAASPSALVSRC